MINIAIIHVNIAENEVMDVQTAHGIVAEGL